MAYNDNKAQERFERQKQRLLEQKQYIELFQEIFQRLPPPRPKSLLEMWRAGELTPGPHVPMYQLTKKPTMRFACIGCGCCRKMAGHLYCEQCLIGRRPYAGWR